MLKYHRIARGILAGNLRNQPYRLNVSLTNLCDSKCKTCDIWQIYPQKRLPLREELTEHEFQNIFRQLPSSVMWVSFSGGEPHLKKDFCGIMESSFRDIRNIAMVNVPNNGIKAERCVRDWKHLLSIRKRPFVYITMSLDGEGEVHDDVRGVKGNYESAVAALTEIDALCKQHGNASIGIGLTISKFNYEKVLPFVRQVLDQKISLKVEAASSGDHFYQGQDADERPDLDHEGIRSVIAEVYTLLNKRQWKWRSPIDYLTRNHVRGTMRFLDDPNHLVIPCRAAHSSYAIDCYGNVNPCFFYTSGLGNVRKYDYDLVRLLNVQQEQVRKAQTTIKKGNCPRSWHACNSIDSMIDRKLLKPWTLFDV